MGIQECPLRKRAEKNTHKKREWEKEDRGGNWVTWMDAWPERQKNLSNYSLPLLGLSRYPRHRSYKLTISQRSSVLQPSLSSTIRFLLFVSLPYLFAFTRAFISTDIYHDFPPLSILIQPFILTSAQHSSWVWGGSFKIPVWGLLLQVLPQTTSSSFRLKLREMNTLTKTMRTNSKCMCWYISFFASCQTFAFSAAERL